MTIQLNEDRVRELSCAVRGKIAELKRLAPSLQYATRDQGEENRRRISVLEDCLWELEQFRG